MKHLQHHYPLYLISLLPLIFFASLLGSDQLLYHGDFARFYYGNQKFCIDSYLQGRLPLWNPYQYCGIPFLANVTLGCFKPFNLLFLFLPFVAACKISAVLLLQISGLATYALLRLWRLQKSSALLGAICWMFSSLFISAISQPPYVFSYVWIPAIFAAWHRTIADFSWRWLIITAIFSAWQLFGGDVQTFLVTSALLIPYCLVLKSPLAKSAVFFLTLVAVVSLLAAVQILPTWEMMQHSVRESGISYSDAAKWSLTPINFCQTFVPGLQGYPTRQWFGSILNNDQPFFSSIFLGSVPLFLLFAGLYLTKNRYCLFAWGVVLVFTAMSFGFFLPLFYYCWRFLPLVNKFRHPVKYMVFPVFFAITIAASHYDLLFRSWGDYRRQILAGIATAGACYTLILVIVIVPDLRSLIGHRMAPQHPAIPIILAPDAFLQVVKVVAVFALLAAAWMLLSGDLRRYIPSVFLLVAVVQMFSQGWILAPIRPAKDILEPGWGEKCLRRYQIGYFRYFACPPIYSLCKQPAWSTLKDLESKVDLINGSRCQVGGFLQVFGFDSARLARTELLGASLDKHQLFALAGVKYLLLYDHLYCGKLRAYPILEQKQLDCVKVFRRNGGSFPGRPAPMSLGAKARLLLCSNPHCFPRTWFPDKVMLVANRAAVTEILALATSLKSMPPLCIEATGREAIDYQSAKATARITIYRPCYVEIECQSDRQRWLVLSDAIYPGWTCDIDGQPAQIYPANLAFRAVQVAAGKHQVVWRYRSSLCQWGGWISLGGWLMALGIVIGYPRRRQQNSAKLKVM